MTKCSKCPNDGNFTETCEGCNGILCTTCQKLCTLCESRFTCDGCNINSKQHPRCAHCEL